MAAPSTSRKNLAAATVVVVLLLLLVVVTTGESAAAPVVVAKQERCRHLSGSYKGICAYSLSCYFVCTDESKDNVDGSCDWLQCWCYTNCGPSSSEIVAADASPPMQP